MLTWKPIRSHLRIDPSSPLAVRGFAKGFERFGRYRDMFLITAKNLGYLVIPGENMLDALRTFHLWFGNEPVVSIQPAP